MESHAAEAPMYHHRPGPQATGWQGARVVPHGQRTQMTYKITSRVAAADPSGTASGAMPASPHASRRQAAQTSKAKEHASLYAGQGYLNVSHAAAVAVKSNVSSTQSAASTSVHPDEDEVGHYQVQIGSTIDKQEPFPRGRYVVVKLLGSGTYGKVVECEDNKYNKTHVAVKLVRREPPLYRTSAKNEIAILRELDGRYGTLKLLREFDHDGHVCMSFELLGDHLSDVLKHNGSLRMDHVRDVSFQLLQAIAYVHSKHIIHTDLKAENILLMSNPQGALSIKVADLGSAIFDSAWHPPLVGTMHYRSPEAVLQAGWSHPLDVWAIACLIIELCTGTHVFELAHDDVHLAMMQRLLGPLPKSLLRRGYANRNQYNMNLLSADKTGAIVLSPCRRDGHEMVRKVMPLSEMMSDAALLDLLQQMLVYEPDDRIAACDAMNHKFFDLDDADEMSDVDSVGASPELGPMQAMHDHAIAPPMQLQRASQPFSGMTYAHTNRANSLGSGQDGEESRQQASVRRGVESKDGQSSPSVTRITTRITLADQAAAGISITPTLLSRASQSSARQIEGLDESLAQKLRLLSSETRSPQDGRV